MGTFSGCFLFLWSALALLVCNGFQLRPSLLHPSKAHKYNEVHNNHQYSSSGTRSSALSMVSNAVDDDECLVPNAGPATVFGRPIDQSTKNRNRDFIHSCKTFLFDTLFQGSDITRSYARFYALENIARMPYFSYVSVLHLYESLGWWRKAEYLKVHFSESWNEQHHLLIMEEMGGSDRWADRFVAQHVAFFYYWVVIAVYMYNPTHAYNLNQAVEEEAYATYSKFIDENIDYLQKQPAPVAAKKYYTGSDLYLFDAMHFDETGSRKVRRPKMKTLYDAFVAVRDDELEHVKTMAYLQDDSCN